MTVRNGTKRKVRFLTRFHGPGTRGFCNTGNHHLSARSERRTGGAHTSTTRRWRRRCASKGGELSVNCGRPLKRACSVAPSRGPGRCHWSSPIEPTIISATTFLGTRRCVEIYTEGKVLLPGSCIHTPSRASPPEPEAGAQRESVALGSVRGAGRNRTCPAKASPYRDRWWMLQLFVAAWPVRSRNFQWHDGRVAHCMTRTRCTAA